METKSQASSDQERRLQELFEAAHRDAQLKLKLLAKPKEVAKEWGVELGEREVERLTKLGAFMELAQEVRGGTLFRFCDPRVCYPSTLWLREEVVKLIIHFPPWPPPGYPADYWWFRIIEEQLDRTLGSPQRRGG